MPRLSIVGACEVLERDLRYVPRVRTRIEGDWAIAEARVPAPGGRVRLVRQKVHIPAVRAAFFDGTEVGWFGSKLVRKAKKKLGKVAVIRGVVKAAKGAAGIAKRIAKSKAFKLIAKTAPIWANVIPPPAGTALAAGAAAAQLAMKIKDAAKKGHKGAKAVISRLRAKKRKGRALAAKVLAHPRIKALPREQKKAAVKRALDNVSSYRVITPNGRTIFVKL